MVNRYFLFEDCDLDMEFVVSETSVHAACHTACDYFGCPLFICELSEEEVDSCGYDVF